jgi:glycerophosphoryl diester phosphodiesterase
VTKPLMIAHNGFEGTVPDSLASLSLALRSADMAEVDVRASADGFCILSHDDRGIGTMGWAEVRERHPRIARLEEALAISREAGIPLNIDLKEGGALVPLLRILRQERALDLCVLTGCGPELAARIRSLEPRLRILLNAEDKAPASPEGYERYCRDACLAAASLGCAGLNVDMGACREPLLRMARKAFIPVCVYTVDLAGEIHRFGEMGVFAITTNRIGSRRRSRS